MKFSCGSRVNRVSRLQMATDLPAIRQVNNGLEDATDYFLTD